MFPGLDLYRTDLAHVTTAGQDPDDLDHDLYDQTVRGLKRMNDITPAVRRTVTLAEKNELASPAETHRKTRKSGGSPFAQVELERTHLQKNKHQAWTAPGLTRLFVGVLYVLLYTTRVYRVANALWVRSHRR